VLRLICTEEYKVKENFNTLYKILPT